MKNAVVTFIFGKHKEILRKPLVKDDDTEYICVTDDSELKSDFWKIVYDPMPDVLSLRDKMARVKLFPFKYTSAENICVLDGALEIKHSLYDFFTDLSDTEMLLKKHPKRDNLLKELFEWKKVRNLPPETIAKFEGMAKYHKFNLSKTPVFESCVIGYKNCSSTQNFCSLVLNYMKYLGSNEQMIMSNQCVISLLMMIHPIKFKYIEQKKFFTRYEHGRWDKCDW